MSDEQNPDESVNAEEGAPQSELPDLDTSEKTALIEALIYTHGEPLSLEVLSEVSRASEMEVREAINQIRTQLVERGSGIELLEVGGKFQFRTRLEFSPYVRELKAGQPRRLSGPALETLAVIAYRQPIVRSDMEKIRGVDVTPTLKTLLERKLIRIVGHQETVGQPALYGTTDDFLKVFGLSSLSQLPTLRDLKELDADPGESAEYSDTEGAERLIEESVTT